MKAKHWVSMLRGGVMFKILGFLAFFSVERNISKPWRFYVDALNHTFMKNKGLKPVITNFIPTFSGQFQEFRVPVKLIADAALTRMYYRHCLPPKLWIFLAADRSGQFWMRICCFGQVSLAPSSKALVPIERLIPREALWSRWVYPLNFPATQIRRRPLPLWPKPCSVKKVLLGSMGIWDEGLEVFAFLFVF